MSLVFHVYFSCALIFALVLLLKAPGEHINLCVFLVNVALWPALVFRRRLIECPDDEWWERYGPLVAIAVWTIPVLLGLANF